MRENKAFKLDICLIPGAHPEILEKGGVLCCFRWSKKAKTTLETIRFWRNISFSVFNVSPFLNIIIKACQ